MSEFMEDIKFTIWSKGPIALKIIRSTVSSHITCAWKNKIKLWSLEEIQHIPQFLKDVGDKKIELVEMREKKKLLKKPVYSCKHDLCEKILERLQQLHQNPKSIVLRKEKAAEIYPRGVDNFWELASMYRHSGEYSEPSTCPENTEAALVFKIMRNCKLFDLDDNSLYEDLLGVRNALMHSPTNQLTYEELDVYMKVLKKFLEAVHESEGHTCEEPNCSFEQEIQKAVSELDNLLKRKTPFERTLEELNMVKKAFEEQKKALEADKQSRAIPSSTIDLLLYENKKRTQQYIVFITKYEYIYINYDPSTRKQEYERLLDKERQEEKERILREEAKRLEEKERKIKEEVEKRVREEIEKLKAEEEKKKQEKIKQQEEEQKKKEEEERQLNEEEKLRERQYAVGSAATGAAMGAVAGPVGAVVGGAIGGLASLIMKK